MRRLCARARRHSAQRVPRDRRRQSGRRAVAHDPRAGADRTQGAPQADARTQAPRARGPPPARARGRHLQGIELIELRRGSDGRGGGRGGGRGRAADSVRVAATIRHIWDGRNAAANAATDGLLSAGPRRHAAPDAGHPAGAT